MKAIVPSKLLNKRTAFEARYWRLWVRFGLCLGLLFAILVVAAQPNTDWKWAKKATGAGNSGSGMAVDAGGNIYSTGSFSGSVTFDTITLSTNNIGLFVAKYDSAGNVLWAKTVAHTQGGASNAIAVDATGNIYLTGSYTNGTTFGGGFILTNQGVHDAFVAKFNSAGNMLWVRRAGGLGMDQATGLTLANQSEIVVTGTFEGSANFGNLLLNSAGGLDIFVVKFNSVGATVWANRAGGPEHDFSLRICTAGTTGLFICGQFKGSAVFGGSTIASHGSLDGFIAKLNNSGTFAWALPIGGLDDDAAVSVKADDQGNALVAGQFFGLANFGGTSITAAGNYDAYLAKYADNGTLNWAKQIGGQHYETATGLCLDAQNRITLAGSYHTQTTIGTQTLPGIGNEDLFVAGFSETGEALWAKSAGGSATDYSADLVIDSAANCYLSGICFGPSEFGNISLTGAGIGSFIARLNRQVLGSAAEQELINQISVFPNPSAGSIFISSPGFPAEKLTVCLYDATGKLLQTQAALPVTAQSQVAFMLPEGLKPGLFFLQLTTGAASKTIKLIKQ